MKFNILIVLCAFFISLSPAFAQGKFFGAESFTLDNGMQVVVIPNHRAPVVMHMVWYKVGAADEQSGETGLAHFAEHVMFKGSDNVAPGAFSRRVKQLGGSDNAFTGHDFTAYHQSISVDHLEEIMTMEADRMKSLLARPEDTESEKLVVIEERRQRTENDPRGYFGEQMRAALFINHPYANPVIGWKNEIGDLTADNIKAFHKKWYAPNNAILVISGDMTAEKLRPLAEKTYGQIPAKDLPQRNWTKVPPLLAGQTQKMHHSSIHQPQWQRAYRVPSYRQDKEVSLAIQVLEEILSGGASARLYKTLVVENKKATDIGFSYYGSNWSDSAAYLSATPAENINIQDLETAIEDQIRAIIKNGITQDELEAAKTRIIEKSLYYRDSLRGPAMIFGQTLATGGTIDDIENWPDNISAVTPEQIQQTVETFLNPDNFAMRPPVTGYILPAQKTEENAK